MLAAINAFQEAFDIKGEVGRLIDVATCDSLLGPDWPLNMQICQKINSNLQEGPRDAARTLRKRIKHKNPKVTRLALLLTEVIVKNCGREMQLQIATRDFMGDMKEVVLNPDIDIDIHRKAVELVQVWGEGFKERQGEFQVFFQTYSALKSQGVRFPEYDAANALDFSQATPSMAFQSQSFADITAGTGRGVERERNDSRHIPHSRSPVSQAYHEDPLSRPTFDCAKLKQDLDQVAVESSLLCDMVHVMAGGGADVERENMSKQLARNLNIYQPRIVNMLEHVQDEEATTLLLAANEETSALGQPEAEVGQELSADRLHHTDFASLSAPAAQRVAKSHQLSAKHVDQGSDESRHELDGQHATVYTSSTDVFLPPLPSPPRAGAANRSVQTDVVDKSGAGDLIKFKKHAQQKDEEVLGGAEPDDERVGCESDFN